MNRIIEVLVILILAGSSFWAGIFYAERPRDTVVTLSCGSATYYTDGHYAVEFSPENCAKDD